MLVLTRKCNESVVIDEAITVKVLDVRGNKVRLGITAPGDVTVDREEVARRRAEFQRPNTGEDSWFDVAIFAD